METQQLVPNPTGVTSEGAKTGGRLRLATIQVDLKPERVQDSLGTDGAASPPSVSLRLAIHQSQTVILGPSGSAFAITFNTNDGFNAGNTGNTGTTAPAA
jgi:hypothetical protein